MNPRLGSLDSGGGVGFSSGMIVVGNEKEEVLLQRRKGKRPFKKRKRKERER